jgi:WhiB family redox-sensing transcriptional regulator
VNEWRNHAACRGMDTELFYAEDVESISDAIAICATCPVRAECLRFAMDNREDFGIWGGRAVGKNLRRRWRAQERRLAERALGFTSSMCGTDGGYYRHIRITETTPCQACRDAHARREHIRRITTAS